MDKKSMLLNAAIQEFAAKGYELASTNEITRKANVSKGILFHYYGGKKQLYLAVIDACIEQSLSLVNDETVNNSGDLFDTIRQIQKIKLKLFQSNPGMHRILSEAFLDMREELGEELRERQARLQNLYAPLLLNKLDTALFRQGIDAGLAVSWVLLSLEALITYRLANFKLGNSGAELSDAVMQELEPYIDMFKFGIYKRGEAAGEH
jgi:TetR/AcrR family transcriptional regulator